jgi:putative flippase GtrA
LASLNTGTTIDRPGVARLARVADLLVLAAIRFVRPVVDAIYSAIAWGLSPVRRIVLCGRPMIFDALRKSFARLTKAWHERAFALKALSFALVGLVNTGVDFSVFWMAARFFGWPLVPANVLAWLVAMTFSYAMNSFITFGPESGRVLRWRDYLTFSASGFAGMVASTMALLALATIMPLVAAKLLSILVSFAVNFLLSHFVVFRTRRS